MLELKNVSFEVEENGSKRTIIDDLSISFKEGGFYVITGPNGGGKSTLAKLIMGITESTKGKILLNGEDITEKNITERAKLGIGYAFQQPPRIKGMTVKDLLTISHKGDLPNEKCCAYLSNVGLCSKEYLNREVDNSLSGGEMKRIEIATLLARDLKLAIFDEPEAGIDLWSFAKLNETFQKMHKEKNHTIIIISHQERILELADEIIVLEDGKVKTRGNKEKVLPDILNQVNGKVCSVNGKELFNE